MSEEVKIKLLQQIRLDQMLEDCVYTAGAIHQLSDEALAQVMDGIYDNYDMQEYLYQCFKQQFKRKDRIEKYIELQGTALEATEEFFEFLDRSLVKELNKVLNNEYQIAEEIVH